MFFCGSWFVTFFLHFSFRVSVVLSSNENDKDVDRSWITNDIIVFIVLAVLVVIIVILGISYYRLRRRVNQGSSFFSSSSSSPIDSSPSRSSGFSDLATAGLHTAPSVGALSGRSRKPDKTLLGSHKFSASQSHPHIYDNLGAIMYWGILSLHRWKLKVKDIIQCTCVSKCINVFVVTFCIFVLCYQGHKSPR